MEKLSYTVLAAIQLLSPIKSPIPEKILLSIAIKAIKTKSIAATLTAILIPSPVPMEMAESKLDPILSLEMEMSVTISSV